MRKRILAICLALLALGVFAAVALSSSSTVITSAPKIKAYIVYAPDGSVIRQTSNITSTDADPVNDPGIECLTFTGFTATDIWGNASVERLNEGDPADAGVFGPSGLCPGADAVASSGGGTNYVTVAG